MMGLKFIMQASSYYLVIPENGCIVWQGNARDVTRYLPRWYETLWGLAGEAVIYR